MFGWGFFCGTYCTPHLAYAGGPKHVLRDCATALESTQADETRRDRASDRRSVRRCPSMHHPVDPGHGPDTTNGTAIYVVVDRKVDIRPMPLRASSRNFDQSPCLH